jgi:hypothetical protein
VNEYTLAGMSGEHNTVESTRGAHTISALMALYIPSALLTLAPTPTKIAGGLFTFVLVAPSVAPSSTPCLSTRGIVSGGWSPVPVAYLVWIVLVGVWWGLLLRLVRLLVRSLLGRCVWVGGEWERSRLGAW